MANKCRYPEEDMERPGNDTVIRTGYFPFECIENERDDPYPARFIKERMDRTVVGISLTYRINRGLEVKESRRKHSVDESKRINCETSRQMVYEKDI